VSQLVASYHLPYSKLQAQPKPVDVDFASDNGDSAFADDDPQKDDQQPSDTVSIPVSTAANPDTGTLPIGWPQNSPGRYPQTQAVIASAVLAGFIASLIFALVFWRPLFGKSKRKKKGHGDEPKASRSDADSDISSIDIEKAETVSDEDPAMRRAIRTQRRAFERALARWKAKARGKAAHHIRDRTQRSRAASIASRRSSSVDSLADRPHPRARSTSTSSSRSTITTRDDLAADHVGGASTAAVPSATTSDTSLDLPRSPTPQIPPPSSPPPLDVENGSSTEGVVPDPPAYRRSLPSASRTGMGVANARDLPSTSDPAPLAPVSEKQRLAFSAAPSSPPPTSLHISEPESAPVGSTTTSEDPTFAHSVSLTTTPTVQRRPFVHVATDDKSVLADLAMRASAPNPYHTVAGSVSPPREAFGPPNQPQLALPAATAPAWDDDAELEYVALDENGAGPSSTRQCGPDAPVFTPVSTRPTTPSLLLPLPPRRMPSRSLGLGSVFDADNLPLPLPSSPTNLILNSYPSAPPDITGSYPSAPSSDDMSVDMASAPTAPSEEDELRDVLQALPQYER